MKADQVLEVVALLQAAYPTFPMPEATVALYARMLGDLPTEGLWGAARQWIASERFFPTVAELRERVLSGSMDYPPLAGDAWAEVLLRLEGRQPEIIHPLIDEVACQMGWGDLCEEMRWTARRPHARRVFLQLYDAAYRRERCEVLSVPEGKPPLALPLRRGRPLKERTP